MTSHNTAQTENSKNLQASFVLEPLSAIAPRENGMPRIQRIRQKIIDRDYYVSSHAEDEMLDDGLERADIENAILKGRIEKKMTEDTRGTRYRIEGPARDGRNIYVICRFKEDDNLIIITAYALTEGI